jgi:ribosomal-protein-alanine N-acetyltransferase
MNVAVDDRLLRQGIATALIERLLELADGPGEQFTLEVRTSNENAMRMYEGFGFKVIGRRRGYYTDNGEDAIVMWSDSIYSPRFRGAFEANLARIQGEVEGLRREFLPPSELR